MSPESSVGPARAPEIARRVGAARARQAAAALLVCLAASCGDGATSPRPTTVRVTVATRGGDPDVDGYQIVLDGTTAPWRLYPDGAVALGELRAGPHTVTLTQVAENCTVSGGPTRTVQVTSGQTLSVAFAVECEATGISVTARTSGVDTPHTFRVLVDALGVAIPLDASGTQLVSRLAPGRHTITLQLPGGACTVTGGGQATVDVAARAVTPVRFDVACVAVTRRPRIAFTADTVVDGVTAEWIGLVAPDGSGRTALVRGGSPAWSPDGTRLALSTTECIPSYYGLYYGSTCAGGLVVIDPEVGNTSDVAGGANGVSPAWAPAGDAIAFLRCCGGVGGSVSAPFITTLDDARVASLSLPGVTSFQRPTWSPDGARLAFGCIVDVASASDVCVVDRDGTHLVRVTSAPSTESDPVWSPDGARIAFTRRVGDTSEIALVTVADRIVTRLTAGADAAWSPDGSALVFADADGLFTIRADGTARTRLTTGAHHAPAWRP